MTTLVTDRQVRCAECGGRIDPQTEVNYLHAAGQFKAEYRHLQCPKKKTASVHQHGKMVQDPEDFLDLRKCLGSCRNLTSFPKGWAPRVCPHCGGGLEVWAA